MISCAAGFEDATSCVLVATFERAGVGCGRALLVPNADAFLEGLSDGATTTYMETVQSA